MKIDETTPQIFLLFSTLLFRLLQQQQRCYTANEISLIIKILKNSQKFNKLALTKSERYEIKYRTNR